MLVNAATEDVNYGIKTLSGPQLFITMINSQAGHAGWWVYTKYAFIADRLRLSNGGSEFAMGGGIELSARETKPYSLTLDIAHAQFALSDGSALMHLLSVTFGVQKGL
jgi:hypothetical protein